MILFRNALAVSALAVGGPLSAAPVLKLTDSGVLVENGAVKTTLAYPETNSISKAKGKILGKSVTESAATLSYKDGGKIDVSIAGNDITYKVTSLPADTDQLSFTASFAIATLNGGQWRFDEKSGAYPAEKTGGQFAQGNAVTFSVMPSSGAGLAFTLPASAYQQLMDMRQFQLKDFYWQCWVPFKAGTSSFTIKVSEVAGGSMPPVAEKPAAPAVEKKPAQDRQSYGQASGYPADKQSGTRILKWQGGKQAAYLLGFDDNGASHLTTVIPELEKRKMAGSFYINPGGALFKRNQAEWEKAAKSPYVHLCNHTFLHSGTQNATEFEADLVKTTDAILALTPHLKKERIIAFRTPGGVPWKVDKKDVATILSKYHMVDRPWLDGPPLTMKTLEPVLVSVDTALANGGTGFMDYHGVGGDPNACPLEQFTKLLDKLDEHRDKFWITDVVSWFQYIEERKKSELKVISSDASQVRVFLTTTVDTAYYNLPLTVAVEVPANWDGCKITQGGKSWEAKAEGGEVRFDAIPGGGEIVIQPK